MTYLLTVYSGATATEVETIAALVAHDGWGAPPLRMTTEQGPMQHGESYRDYRLKARRGQLVFRLADGDLATMYTHRDELVRLFAAGSVLGLEFLIGGSRRRIDGYVANLMTPWRADDWGAQKVSVEFYAPEPTFYDPAGEAVTVQADYDASGGGVPADVPFGVGSSVLDKTYTINYPGTWCSYPVVRITGPVTNPVVLHGETGDKLDFTGTTINAGDYYEIDTRYGYKTVKDSSGVNQISKLTTDSDLSTFRIMPVLPGETTHANAITCTGSAISTATKVDLTFFDRYLGI